MDKTIADLSKESGISQARIRGYLKDVEPSVKLGRNVGYTEESFKLALRLSHYDVISYLGLTNAQEAEVSE